MNAAIEGLFLLAFWAPPLTVVACALSLLVKGRSAPRSHVAARVVSAAR